MTVWMLVVWMMGTRVVVPGIETKFECERLAQELGPGKSVLVGPSRCIEYRIASR
jgi:hypothetical protein